MGRTVKRTTKQHLKPKEVAVEAGNASDDSDHSDALVDDFGTLEKSDSGETDYSDSESDHESQSDNELDDQEFNNQLNSLQEKDPKFYSYLLQNDAELLAGIPKSVPDEPLNLQHDLQDEQDNEERVSKEEVLELIQQIKQNSIPALRKLLALFKTGMHELKGDLIDEECFRLVLVASVKYSVLVFGAYLNGAGFGQDDKDDEASPTTKKYKKIRSLIKSFLTALIQALSTQTDPSMLKFMLKATRGVSVYFANFPKLTKDYLKVLIGLWCESTDEQIGVISFLALRRLVVASVSATGSSNSGSGRFLDVAIKSSCHAFIASSRSTNAHTIVHLTFMTNCIIELCALHLSSAYQHMFVNLRQMAMKLRTAITAKTKEAFKTVYNWQYLSNLKLWGKLLCTYCKKEDGQSELFPLVYPFVQIATGVLRLKPSSKHFPFRFHIVNLLIEIGEVTGVYIPLASHILQIFDSAELKGKPKPSSLKPLDFNLSIHAPSMYLGTKTYHSGVLDLTIAQLFSFFSSHASSIAFPELVVPAIMQLKRVCKVQNDFNMNKHIQGLVDKLQSNSAYIIDARNKISYSPVDFEMTKDFMKDITGCPLFKFNQSRKLVMERQTPKEKVAAVESEDNEEHNDEVKNIKKTKKKVSENEMTTNKNDDLMDIGEEWGSDADDFVEPFVLSDMEE